MISMIFLFLLIALFFLAMKRIMRRDNFINHLVIQFYDNGAMTREELITEIYNYVINDFRLKKVVAKYNATQDDFYTIFDKLIYWGNFKKRSRYVPIYSFFYVSSLEKVLKMKDEDAKKLTMKMMNHFHI